MLRWSLPEATTKFDVSSVVTGSVTPASCCFFLSLHLTIGRRSRSSGPLKTGSHCCHSLFWSLSTSGTLVRARHFRYSAVPVVFLVVAKSAAHTHSRSRAQTHTRTHAHTQGTMPCCGCCWPWPGGKFFATVPRPTKRKAMNSTNAFRKCPHYARRRSF